MMLVGASFEDKRVALELLDLFMISDVFVFFSTFPFSFRRTLRSKSSTTWPHSFFYRSPGVQTTYELGRWSCWFTTPPMFCWRSVMVTDEFKPDKPQGIESKQMLNLVFALELCAKIVCQYTKTAVK